MACITRPVTCGPSGAAISVWLKIDALPPGSGIISSKGYSTSGFMVVAHPTGKIA